MKRLGFVGSGVMTEAIVTGLMKARGDIASVALSPRSAGIAARLAAAYSTTGGLNEQVFHRFLESGGADAMTTALESVLARISDAPRHS